MESQPAGVHRTRLDACGIHGVPPLVGVRTSTVSLVKLWVEAFEFDARILGGKLPVNPLVPRMASLLPGAGFSAQCLDIWNPPIQALSSEGTQFNFGDIEPAAVFGGIVDFKPFGQCPRLLGRIGLIE